MSQQQEPKIEKLSEFQRCPEYLFGQASNAGGVWGSGSEYLVTVHHGGMNIDVMVTSLFQAGVQTPRDEKLSKYAKNPEALGRAIERAFQQAASGTPVKITTTPGCSGSRTAIIIRANMKG